MDLVSPLKLNPKMSSWTWFLHSNSIQKILVDLVSSFKLNPLVLVTLEYRQSPEVHLFLLIEVDQN
jgi:hypothetical protein